MSTSEWHADEALLAAYAHGAVDDADAFSVEAHIVSCEAARRPVLQGRRDERLPAGDLARHRRHARRAAARGRRGRPDQAGRRRRTSRRLLAATPSLAPWPWLGATTVALAAAVLGAYQGERVLALFLGIAALLAPVAGVAASFTRGVDPTHELGLAAPTCRDAPRPLLLRTVAVAGTTPVLTVIGALTLPDLELDGRGVAAARARPHAGEPRARDVSPAHDRVRDGDRDLARGDDRERGPSGDALSGLDGARSSCSWR